MDFREGLDDVEKRKFLILPGLELRPLSHPARSQSLHRLHSTSRRHMPEDGSLQVNTLFHAYTEER
jgi:hypothetical protein